MFHELKEREKAILRYIIEDFIRTANPVGSGQVAKKSSLSLSSATIRNVMSDLEDMNYLTHQHTSGGRMPTDKGYRYFVDELMSIERLKPSEKSRIKKSIGEVEAAGDEIYKEVSKILGKITKEISIVSQPYFSEGIFTKLELVDLSSTKLLVVVSIQSGLVRTLIFDIESGIKRDKLDRIASILNEKLSGLTLLEIKKTYKDRVGDLITQDSNILKVFVDSIDRIFHDEKEGMTLYIGGTVEILSQPEFGDTKSYKDIIEITSDTDVVVHVLNRMPQDASDVLVSIGEENEDEKLKSFSIVSTTYKAGSITGKIALIGPRRMDYSKMISLLNYTSNVIEEKL